MKHTKRSLVKIIGFILFISYVVLRFTNFFIAKTLKFGIENPRLILNKSVSLSVFDLFV